MGAVTTTVLGPTSGPVRSEGAPLNMRIVPFSMTMSSSYATGGDTIDVPGDVNGVDIVAVFIANPFNGTYTLVWDGSTSAPKIKAYSDLDATPAEVSNATNLAAVTARGFFLVK